MTERMTTSERTKDLASRTRSVVWLLRQDANHADKERRWLAGYEAENLLWRILPDLQELVEIVNVGEDDWFIEEIEKQARAIASQCRARRIARKLENVEGRTAEEAEVFLARAAELRESHDA